MAEAPDAVRSAGIDLLLVDQTTPGPAIVAEHLGIPLVLVSNALMLNREATIPPFFTPWAYSTNPIAQVRNRLAYAAHRSPGAAVPGHPERAAARLEPATGGDRWIRRLRGGAHQPAARLLRFSAPVDAAELLVYRTVPRCPRASAVPVSLGAADRAPADLCLDGHAAESPGTRVSRHCGGLPRARCGRGDFAGRGRRNGAGRASSRAIRSWCPSRRNWSCWPGHR